MSEYMTDYEELCWDVEADEPVPCVMCMCRQQRGDNGCCSEECLNDLMEAYGDRLE